MPDRDAYLDGLLAQFRAIEHGPASAVGLESAGTVPGQLYSKRPGQNKARF